MLHVLHDEIGVDVPAKMMPSRYGSQIIKLPLGLSPAQLHYCIYKALVSLKGQSRVIRWLRIGLRGYS